VKGKGRAKAGAELGESSQTATGKRGGKVQEKGEGSGQEVNKVNCVGQQSELCSY
jgi:hypothetical protein